jgi:hypothetical protein
MNSRVDEPAPVSMIVGASTLLELFDHHASESHVESAGMSGHASPLVHLREILEELHRAFLDARLVLRANAHGGESSREP